MSFYSIKSSLTQSIDKYTLPVITRAKPKLIKYESNKFLKRLHGREADGSYLPQSGAAIFVLVCFIRKKSSTLVINYMKISASCRNSLDLKLKIMPTNGVSSKLVQFLDPEERRRVGIQVQTNKQLQLAASH